MMDSRPNPRERKDAICGALFVLAVAVGGGNAEKGDFGLMFWAACGLALLVWICVRRKWILPAGLLAVVAFRAAVAFALGQGLTYLAVATVSSMLLVGLAWWRRNDD